MKREELLEWLDVYASNVFRRKSKSQFTRGFKRVKIGKIVNTVTPSLDNPYVISYLAPVTATARVKGAKPERRYYVFEIGLTVLYDGRVRSELLGCFPHSSDLLHGKQGGESQNKSVRNLLHVRHNDALVAAPPVRRSESIAQIRAKTKETATLDVAMGG